MDRFDIVVVPFPFTDRATTKRRPALVVSSEEFFAQSKHVICAMITTAGQSAWESDIEIFEWESAGLPKASKVRFKLFTLDGRFVLRHLGSLSGSDRQRIQKSLSGILF